MPDRRAHFVEGGEIGQEPGPEIDNGNRPRLIVPGCLGITGEGRKIEEPDRKSLLVDAVDQVVRALKRGAHGRIFARPSEARPYRRFARESARGAHS